VTTEWARVKELFHAALEREPDARGPFLDTECADPAIRAEVERLLRAHANAGAFIEAPAMEPAGVTVTPPPLTGRVMGHYRIGRFIGAGGMGAVYEAQDVDLGRSVALKVVSGHALEAQEQLRREAQQASQLNHPHICTIHEVGAADGQAYFAMEYVEGRTISQLLDGRALPAESALRYGAQIADALAHAHDHGVIHRDLKSANVMVTSDGRAKVLDFGLACRIERDRVSEMTQSQEAIARAGPVAGTLPYMAPELLRGQPIDARTDIWALGVMLYEMATGRRPFDGASGFELSAAILNEPPAPFPETVSPLLRGIIRRCLAKDRHDRYVHAGEVRSALEAVRAEAIGTADHARGEGARRAVSRRTMIAVSAALAAVVALGLGWRWLQPTRGPVGVGISGRPAVAVMPFDNVTGADDAAWLSSGVPTMLLTGLAQTRGLEIVGSQALQDALGQVGLDRLESLDRTQIADVARRAGAGAVVVGSVARSGSELRIDARLEDLTTGRVLVAETVRGPDVFALVDQLAARIREGVGFADASDIRPLIDVSTRSVEAYRLYTQALGATDELRWNEAQLFLREAVAIDPGFAEAYLQLALITRLNGREVSWREHLRKAAEHAGRLNERERLFLAVETARVNGTPAEAARVLDDLLAKYPDAGNAIYVVSQLYAPFGGMHDPGKATKILEAAVAARPSNGRYRNNLGYGLLEAGRYEEAIREFETYARLAPREPNPYDSLGEAYLTMGDAVKAVDYYSRALTVDPRFVYAHNGRAWGLAMLGRYDEAIAENAPDAPLRAFVLSRAGRYADAERVLDAALLEPAVAESTSTRGSVSLLRALFALERRQYARTRQALREADTTYARMNPEDRRPYLVLLDSLTGTLDVAQQQPDAAASRLAALKRRYNPAFRTERAWAAMLEGDLALAAGRLPAAADAYASGEPDGRMWLSSLMLGTSIIANHLPSRDGPARVAKARGDLPGAIQAYRRLTSANGEQKWSAMLEPRYVLEIARLLARTGDAGGAAAEYRRFLELWKNADVDLPELAEARRALASTGGASR
jgi:TolB-like protein/Tfp pilus assembly protein PilF